GRRAAAPRRPGAVALRPAHARGQRGPSLLQLPDRRRTADAPRGGRAHLRANRRRPQLDRTRLLPASGPLRPSSGARARRHQPPLLPAPDCGGRSMKVVVFGATGTIGRPLVEELAKEHEVTAVSRHDRPDEDNVTWAQADATDAGSVARVLEG